MKVLIVYSDLKCSCTAKCTFELQKGISHYIPTDTRHIKELVEGDFKTYNAIIFQRLGANGYSLTARDRVFLENTVKKYRSETQTLYFLDDLILNNDTTFMMSLVDTLCVPNQSYDKHTTIYNSNVFHTRTFVDIKETEKPSRFPLNKKGINLIWASTGGLGAGFMHSLVPYLERHLSNANIFIIGNKSGEFRKYANTTVLPILSYEKYISYLKSCDVCLNPISSDSLYFRNIKNTDFINCKSEIKYLLAGISKTPMVSSKSIPYEYAIKNGVTGFVLDNNLKEWLTSIKKLITNKPFKKDVVNNAYNHVKKDYSLESIGVKFRDLLNSWMFTKKETTKKETTKKIIIPEFKNNILVDIDQSEGGQHTGEIFGNKNIKQRFISRYSNFFKVEIRVSTYMRVNKGTLRIRILDEKCLDIIREKDIPCSSFIDNSWHAFEFKPIIESAEKTYFITIQGINCRVGSSVTLSYNSRVINNSGFYINRTNFTGTLSFRTYAREGKTPNAVEEKTLILDLNKRIKTLKPKVGWITLGDPHLGSSRIGVWNIHRGLLNNNYSSVILRHSLDISDINIIADLKNRIIKEEVTSVVFHKVYGNYILEVVSFCKEIGVSTIFANGDWFESNMYTAVDHVISGSPYVQSKLKESYGIQNSHYIDDALETLEYPIKKTSSKSKSLNIGWFGNYSKLKYAKDLIKSLKLKNSKFLTVSNAPCKFTRLEADITMGAATDKKWDPDILLKYLLKEIDVIVLPIDLKPELTDHNFAKTANRLTLAMSLGIPVVASPIPSYELIVINGVNGFLARNKSEWKRFIESLYSPSKREEMGKYSIVEIREKFRIDSIIKSWVSIFEDKS